MPMRGRRSPVATASDRRARRRALSGGTQCELTLGELFIAAPDAHDEGPAAVPFGEQVARLDDKPKDLRRRADLDLVAPGLNDRLRPVDDPEDLLPQLRDTERLR